MKRNFYSVFAVLAMSAGALTAQTARTAPVYVAGGGQPSFTDSLNFTGGIQTWTVPCGVTSVNIDVYGAEGGAGATGGNSATGGPGGLGGHAMGTLAVTPGQILNIFVGGAGATPTGGFNGGANGGSTNAGGGGGATDIRVNGTALTDRVLTAGGGGGGGRAGCETNTVAGGAGGSGNGTNGANGFDAPTPGGVAGGGFGGTISAGGNAGIGCGGFLGAPGTIGASGNGGDGGAGQSCCCFTFGSIPGGGGGGGGFIGGGGGGGGSAGTTGCSGNDKGAGGGGAGGSCDVSGASNGVVGTPSRTGNGAVYITYVSGHYAPSASAVSTTLCLGDSTAASMGNLDNAATVFTWTCNPAGLTFSTQSSSTMIYGTTAGTYTVYATQGDASACFNSTSPADSFTVVVNALPTVTFSTQALACLADANVALSATPVGGTFSGTAVTGNNFDPQTAGVGAHVITYMYTDSLTGCSASATSTINVDACLGVTDINTNGISVSPNPASDVLNVTWSATTSVSTIKVMDVTGRVVMTESVANGNSKQLNISNLAAGTYTVATEGASGKTSYTFVKK